ncbi:hypothetical protein ACFZAM_34570 [Streptomyces sp. NPDC008079]|uniref:hypothetical protein n=1 Tax=Streptomyces sp. NPDC008079 TaxID=3364806 RepID=UPI0036EEA2A3
MRKGLAAAGVVAMIAAGSAACGTAAASSPDTKVKNAFEKLNGEKSLTLGVRFDASADQIYTALQGEEDFTKETAKTLADLRVAVALSADKAFKDLKDGDKSSFAFQLGADGSGKKSLVDVRAVNDKVYLRLDLKGFETLIGSSSKDAAQLNEFLGMADELPASLASVKSALKGDWISLDLKSFESFAKSMSKDGDSPLGALPDTSKGLDAKTQQQVVDALRKALVNNAKFKELGNHDGADHVEVTVPARQVAKELEGSLGSLTRQIPDFKPSDLEKVPNKTVAVDVAVKGGKLAGISLDVAQFDTKAKGKLPLVVDVNGGADPVGAPSGAKVLNPQDLMGLFMFAFGHGDDSSADDSGLES